MPLTSSVSGVRGGAAFPLRRGRRLTSLADRFTRLSSLIGGSLMIGLLPAMLTAQAVVQSGAPTAAPASVPPAPVPFATGEHLEYDVKFGFLHVGGGSMEVTGVDSVRGRAAWHTVFHVHGGTLFFKVNDRLESWIDVSTLVSLRHWQELSQGRRERERRYEIMPERGIVLEEGKPEAPTVAAPLDDGAFFYFVRTIPLEVGQTYEFNRYFRPDRN